MRCSQSMEQFAYHVQRRLLRMPSTVNFFHSALSNRSYPWFHSRTLFGREGLLQDQVKLLADEYSAPLDTLWNDASVFLKYAPYALLPSAPIRLQTGAPNTPFTLFLKQALSHHPPQVVRSLRRGSDKITATSFFVSFWISQYAIRPYFEVGRGSCCSVCHCPLISSHRFPTRKLLSTR